MSDIAIKVEDVGKLYRLGEIGTGTISHDLNRWWAKMRGKEDPFAKIGETNDRTVKGQSEYVWALKDINFEVKKGEVLGIIGRNGAGKSTLLKVLSKVTTPSTGQIKVRGRIASLLEVGTGFHPELTGRENIYLNGAILGMTKSEIRAKFDEIVDFSGVERYIDTPVKRYSSGMYVRLAFAVAAFLEPEILIVDEVLAVGDAEFQKKCLGRMKDVSVNDGRTVLFVSHNMPAVQKLCNTGLFMTNGTVNMIGNVEQIIKHYNASNQTKYCSVTYDENNAPGKNNVKVLSIQASLYNEPCFSFLLLDEIKIKIFFKVDGKSEALNASISIFNDNEDYVLSSPNLKKEVFGDGMYSAECIVPSHLLNEGMYYVTVLMVGNNFQILCQLDSVICFEVTDDGTTRGDYLGKWSGIVRPLLKWETKKVLM